MNEADYAWSAALARAIKRNRRDVHNRYLQLATVRRDGTPAVRSLVCREFCTTSMQLRMVTDGRSGKVEEIADNPAGEICWYFTHSREQFRLRGILALSGADDGDQSARAALWAALSDKAKEQFLWPHPAQPVAAHPAPLLPVAEMPPDCFLALALAPHRVDHLTLRGEPQTRFISTLGDAGQWTSVAVNP